MYIERSIKDKTYSKPRLFYATFTSTVKSVSDGDTQIADSNTGYLDELKLIGQANVLPGTINEQSAPYSDRLRPVRDLSQLYKAVDCELLRLSYWVYDPTLKIGAGAVTGQSLSSLNEIENSLVLPNDAYAQSRFRFGEIAGAWQPNGFDPSFKINGSEFIIGNGASAFDDKNNKGDLSIGRHFPFDLTFTQPIYIGKITDLQARGQVYQLVETVPPLFQRYIVQCDALFLIN